MANQIEIQGINRFPEQIKEGITLTERTLRHFGIEDTSILKENRVKFTSEEVIKGIETETFLNENRIVAQFSSDSDFLTGEWLTLSGKVADKGNVIYLSAKFFEPLFKYTGLDIKRRTLVSGMELIYFDTLVNAFMGIKAKQVSADDSAGDLKKYFIEEFSDYVSGLNKNFPNDIRAQKFADEFYNFFSKDEQKKFDYKTKGLLSSLYAGDKSLITANYDLDQEMRLLLMRRMRRKFMDLAAKRLTWFSPPQFLLEHLDKKTELSEFLEEFVESLGEEKTTSELLKLYLDGQMGLKFLNDLKDSQGSQNPLMEENLAEKLKASMMSANENSMNEFNYSEPQEYADHSEESEEQYDDEYANLMPVRKKRMTKMRKFEL